MAAKDGDHASSTEHACCSPIPRVVAAAQEPPLTAAVAAAPLTPEADPNGGNQSSVSYSSSSTKHTNDGGGNPLMNGVRCLDRYLALTMRQRRTNRLRVDECHTLARSAWTEIRSRPADGRMSAALEQTIHSAAFVNDTERTDEERFLVYFLTLACPSLYQWQEVPIHVSSHGTKVQLSLSRDCLHQVESVQFASEAHRNQVLHTLLCQRQPTTAPLDTTNDCSSVAVFVRNAMRGQRTSMQPEPTRMPEIRALTSTVANTTLEHARNSDVTSLLDTNRRTTVEERVRARAALAQRHATTTAAAATTGTTNGTTPMTSTTLLRLADAVWSHSNAVRTRRPQTAAARTKMIPRPQTCRVPLTDLVSVLQTSLVVRGGVASTGQSGAGHVHTVRGERTSKRHLVEALVTLASRYPTWIQIAETAAATRMDHVTTATTAGTTTTTTAALSQSSLLPSKQAVVRIASVDYQAIRNELAAVQSSLTRPRRRRGGGGTTPTDDTWLDATATRRPTQAKRQKDTRECQWK